MNIKIPNRFETLFSSIDEKLISTLILEPKEDLIKFQRIALEIQQSNQGKIVFLQGKPGIGKSTFSYSIPIFLSSDYSRGIQVPPEQYKVKLTDIPEYIYNNFKDEGKISIVTVDNRESPRIDEKDFYDLFSNLKILLRDNKNLLILWPVVQEEFARKAIKIIEEIGGKGSLSFEPIINYKGLDVENYFYVLERIFRISSVELDDFGISLEEVKDIQNSGLTIGEFLNAINNLVIRNTELDPLENGFRKLIIVMSSSSESLLNHARDVRRGDTFYLEASRLLMNTPDSNIGEWWKQRNDDPQTKLAYVINRFQAEFATITPTAVVHACSLYGELDLKELTKSIVPNLQNAKTSLMATELYKVLSEGKDNSTRRGNKPSKEVLEAYSQIQKVSEKRHKAINSAIMMLLNECMSDIPEIQYEKGENGIVIDVIVTDKNQKKQSLEFHHKSDSHYNQNKISRYILDKIAEYAIAYGLAKR